ncbi:MAG: SDR family NAD(P)-dependent oxidoreductase, partial [Reyranellaceae bacterium]
MKLFDLTGKAAVVTGGNGGIGLGMARGLVEAGAAVLVVGRNEKKNDAAVRALRALGGKAEAFLADVTNETQCAAMVDTCIGRFGRLDALFDNAGINIRKAPQDLALDEWRQVIDVNLTSAFLCSKAAYSTMKAAGGGKIINTGSMLSIFGVR